MFSVSQRIKSVKQPRGGYINPKTMIQENLVGGIDQLNPEENVHASLIGMTVDYMTRFMSGSPVEIAFQISMMGATIIGEQRKAQKLLSHVQGLDDRSIISAIKLTGFDVCLRAGVGYRPVETIEPNMETINNVRIMVNRSLIFFKKYGPIILDGFTMEGGYTDIVSSGDGDFVTKNGLWEFKVSKSQPQKEHTLQLLMYWRMGLRSVHHEFANVEFLGIYNPRLNSVFSICVNDIPFEIISEVEKDVIGYKDFVIPKDEYLNKSCVPQRPCTHCGEKIDASWEFCPMCGSYNKPLFCECGFRLIPDGNYCMQCGKKVN